MSTRTWTVLGVGLAVLILSVAAMHAVPGAGAAGTWASGAPDILLSAMAASVVLWSRTRMDDDDPLRGSWLALGAGCVVFCAAEVTYFAGVVAGAGSLYATLSEVLFVASFPLVIAGLAMAFRAFRRGQDWILPLSAGGMLGVFLAVELYVGALSTVVSDTAVPLGSRLVALFYPIADVLFVLPWIFALIFMLIGARKRPVSWPWWTVAAGVLMGVASDTAFAVQSASGSYDPGGLADAGSWLMYLSVAVAAPLTVDILASEHDQAVAESARSESARSESARSESATI